MNILSKKESFFLFLGDLLIFVVSLWLTLFIRYWSVPTEAVFVAHLLSFMPLFLFWAIIFFVFGLYERHTTVLTNRLFGTVLTALAWSIFFAVVFFYLWPVFGFTPKTILLIYLVVSFVLVCLWRFYGHQIFTFQSKERAVIIGSGEELYSLRDEINNNKRYGLNFISSIDLDRSENVDFQKDILERIYAEGVSIIVVDLSNPKIQPILPHLYNLLFSRLKFIDLHKLYEGVFERIPLSSLRYDWFVENISLAPRPLYDFSRRLIDIVLAIVLLPFLALAYIIVFVVKKFEDNRSIMIFQERVGCYERIIKIAKFRTWLYDDAGDEEAKKNNKITRIGAFLRKTRVDELPQIWNVLKGDLSFIGPRPELPVLVKSYEKEIPYYNVRHLIKPGLSGWAQLQQDTPTKASDF